MSSSPPTPRSQIEQFLKEQKTSKPVKRQTKRRESSSGSRRQSLNNSTLRKQALLSSATKTERAASLNDTEQTPRSQIQDFLTAAQTGIPVARQKKRTRHDVSWEDTSFKRPKHTTSSILDMTEDTVTPRTAISNILESNETGLTAAPVKHYRNIPRSPYTQSRNRNESLQHSSSRSPLSNSLLDITLQHKDTGRKFGHVPSIRPKASAIADALSQIKASAESVNVTTIYTGADGIEHLDNTAGTTTEEAGVEDLVDLAGVEEDVDAGVKEEVDEVDAGVEEEADVEEEEADAGVDEQAVDDDEEEEEEEEEAGVDVEQADVMSEHVSNSSTGIPVEGLPVPDISAHYKPASTQHEDSIDNQSHHSYSLSMDHSVSFMDASRQTHQLVIPSEVPKKPRVQLQIDFPVLGKQSSTATGPEKKKKSFGLGAKRPRAVQSKPVKVKDRLPRSLTKSIFCHFSRSKNITPAALDEVEKACDHFWTQFTTDVVTFANHAGRVSVTEDDVELLMRRQGFVTEKQSMYNLVEKYLPMEYREQIIPMARPGNKVYPRK